MLLHISVRITPLALLAVLLLAILPGSRAYAGEIAEAQQEEESTAAYDDLSVVSLGDTRRGPLPLVLFLHGLNLQNTKHPWVGDGPVDLVEVAYGLVSADRVSPFILAAPSQVSGSRRAKTLWSRVELDKMVDDVERQVGRKGAVDRSKVIVLGHSGAACSADAGLCRIARERGVVRPLAVVAVDTCTGSDIADALADAPPSTHVRVYFQDRDWPRNFHAFQKRLAWHPLRRQGTPGTVQLKSLPARGKNPHDEIVPQAFELALTEFLAPGHGALASYEAH